MSDDRRDTGPVEFGIEVVQCGELRVVALAGEVDLYTAPAFERALAVLLDEGARELVVDLVAATFVDSTFLGVLIGAHKRLARVGGRLSVVCADPKLAKVFAITGLDRVFPIHDSLADAADSRTRVA